MKPFYAEELAASTPANPLVLSQSPGSIYQNIIDAVDEKGYIVVPNALPDLLLDQLYHQATVQADQFSLANIGRGQQSQFNRFVRRDKTRWFDGKTIAETGFLSWMADLQTVINQQLFMGLFSYECHFARYGYGDFYRKHYDAFAGESNRVLSTVLYLNPDWQSGDGGELVLYPDPSDSQADPVMIKPKYGTLVVFLSEEFPHEVLPCYQERFSIAGWFRVNGSSSTRLDPPR